MGHRRQHRLLATAATVPYYDMVRQDHMHVSRPDTYDTSDMRSFGALADIWPTRDRFAERGDVLEAVLNAIRERGSDAVRFQDVAELAGTSISNLQYVFGSRAEMISAGFRFGVERDLDYLDRIAGSGEKPWRRLVKMVESCLYGEGDLGRSRLEWLELWRAGVRDPDLFKAFEVVYAAWRDRFGQVVHDGIHKGEFQPTSSVDSIITLLFAIIDGLTVPVVVKHPINHREVRDMVLVWLSGALGVETF